MSQRVGTRVREPEPATGNHEENNELMRRKREQTANGVVVVHTADREWEVNRQGRLRYFCFPRYWDKQAAPGWKIFEQDIVRHSGKHVHQGGIVIFVLEGKGYTIVDGVRYDWEKGDLIVLPIKRGGVEHQHFNSIEGAPCRWVAFVNANQMEALGNWKTQLEDSSVWRPS